MPIEDPKKKKGSYQKSNDEFTRNAEMRVAQEYKKGKSEYNPSKGIYESTPMKNAAIDYIKGKDMYRGGGLKGTEYNK
jgi:hypothetical protein